MRNVSFAFFQCFAQMFLSHPGICLACIDACLKGMCCFLLQDFSEISSANKALVCKCIQADVELDFSNDFQRFKFRYLSERIFFLLLTGRLLTVALSFIGAVCCKCL